MRTQSKTTEKQIRPDNKWWIKWWTHETMYGSFMLAPLDELGFLVKLCVLSKLGNYPGYIKATETEAITHVGIAGMMGMASDLANFERLLKIHKDKGRITEDEKGIIYIVNFEYYQFEKGKPRRSKKELEQIIESKKSNKRSMKAVVEGNLKTTNELTCEVKGLRQDLKDMIPENKKRGRPKKV